MILMDEKGHLVSDKSEAQLYAFAHRLRLRRSWYQEKRLPHYDLTTARMRYLAILNGAKLVSSREIVRALKGVKSCGEWQNVDSLG